MADADTRVDSQQASPCKFGTTFVNYLLTPKGVVLFVEIILCVVILACFKVSEVEYYYLAWVELILAVFFFVLYLCSLQDKMPWISWPWCDFFRSIAAAILFLVSSIPAFSPIYDILVGILGMYATFVFGFDALISFPSSE